MSEQQPETAATPRSGALAPQIEARRGMMTTEGGGAMLPRDLSEVMELSRILSGSGMLPECYQGNQGNVFVAIQMGMELGLPPMQALQNIAVIKGRPSLWGDAMLAVIRAHPQFGSIQEMDIADITKAKKATCVLTRKGEPAHTSTFSIDDAKTAGLWGKTGPWTNYPSRMLMLRARAFACRNVFPDALRGIHSAEEQSDIPSVEAVATVKSSSILERVQARQADAKPVVVVDAAHEPINGEASDAEERQMEQDNAEG